MKTTFKIAILATSLVLMLIADVPFLTEQLVPEAEAIFGVRRRALRRGVIIGSTMGLPRKLRRRLTSRRRPNSPPAPAAPLRHRLRPPANRCRWAPWFPPSPGVVRQHRSAAWSITTAAATSIARCFRATNWCM